MAFNAIACTQKPDAHGQGPAARREAALPCGGSGLEYKSNGARLGGGWRGEAAHGPHAKARHAFSFYFYYILTALLRRSFHTKKTPFTLEKTSFTLTKNGTGSLHLSREGPPPYFWLGRCFLGVFDYIFCCKILRAMDNHVLLTFYAF